MAKLYFYFSAMNAGKSTTLLQSAFNYRERGMNVAIFTARLDTRDGVGEVSSRIGLKSEAYVFDDETNLFEVISELHRSAKLACIFVDEAQFLAERHVVELARIVDVLSLPVLCYGLRTDFQGELFSGSCKLLAIADELHELKTICFCGSKATMNLRVDGEGKAVREGESIEVGGNERYLPMCRKHFFERFNERSNP